MKRPLPCRLLTWCSAVVSKTTLPENRRGGGGGGGGPLHEDQRELEPCLWTPRHTPNSTLLYLLAKERGRGGGGLRRGKVHVSSKEKA